MLPGELFFSKLLLALSNFWLDHRLYRLHTVSGIGNVIQAPCRALNVASQYILNGQLLGSRPLKMANF